VIKSGHAMLFSPQIVRDTAGMKIIYMLRDGRAVYRSKKQTISTMGVAFSRSVINCARYWALFNKMAEQYQKEIITIKFEDLVTTTEESLNGLLAELDCAPVVDVAASQAYIERIGPQQRHLHENVGEPKASIADAWKQSLNVREIRLYQAVAGPSLLNNNYSLEAIPKGNFSDGIGYSFFVVLDWSRMYSEKMMNFFRSMLDGTLKERIGFALHRTQMHRDL
ncbi:MAG: sulfotransferase, partial [Deltaproteobacteria bacterium]|nr:sulfotransferase [Deltaproteobacteria bacterium]